MKMRKSKQLRIHSHKSEVHEIELLEIWIEFGKWESGSNPLSFRRGRRSPQSVVSMRIRILITPVAGSTGEGRGASGDFLGAIKNVLLFDLSAKHIDKKNEDVGIPACISLESRDQIFNTYKIVWPNLKFKKYTVTK